MNINQVLSIMRAVLMGLGGILVAKGITDPTGLEQAVGAVVMLVSAAWSMLHHSTNPVTMTTTTGAPVAPKSVAASVDYGVIISGVLAALQDKPKPADDGLTIPRPVLKPIT